MPRWDTHPSKKRPRPGHVSHIPRKQCVVRQMKFTPASPADPIFNPLPSYTQPAQAINRNHTDTDIRCSMSTYMQLFIKFSHPLTPWQKKKKAQELPQMWGCMDVTPFACNVSFLAPTCNSLDVLFIHSLLNGECRLVCIHHYLRHLSAYHVGQKHGCESEHDPQADLCS